MIRYYVKKPIPIAAALWDGVSDAGIVELLRDAVCIGRSILISRDGRCLLIHTLEGVVRADPGDYIIRGVGGKLYPCKPDIFAATYDEVQL
jgi:hypothetical protein